MFSIILPVHNNESTLSFALDSILHQMHPDDELLIIDDSSIDNSLYIINNYINEYSDITEFDPRFSLNYGYSF